MLNLNLGNLVCHLLGDNTKFARMIHTSELMLDKFSRHATRIGRQLTYMVSAPLAGLSALSVKLASDAEEIDSKFRVTFRNVQTQAMAAMNQLDKSYGMNEVEAKNLLASTGDLLTGFGFEQKAALDLSTQVQRLAVDLASFQNLQGGAKRASESLTKALLGERESAKLLGIVIREEDVKARILANTKKGLRYATENQAKAYATLQIAMEQSKNAIGDYARTSQSFANQWREMWSDLKMAGVEFGRIVMPIAKDFLATIRGWIDYVRALTPETKMMVAKMVGLAIIIPPIIWGLGLLAGGLKNIIVLFRVLGIRGILTLGIIGLGIWALIDLFTAGEAGFNSFVSSIRIGSMKVGTALQLSFTYIWEGWDYLIRNLTQSWYWVKDKLIQAWGVVERVVLRIMKGISKAFWWMVEGVVEGIVFMGLKLVEFQENLGLLGARAAAGQKLGLLKMKMSIVQHARDMDDIYNKQIANSLKESQKSQLEHYKIIGKAQKEHTAKMAHWATVRSKILAADKTSAGGSGGNLAAQILAAMGPETSGMESSAMGGLPKKASTGVAGGSFREVSLRRISLAQPVAARKAKQEVRDEQVSGKLDQIYQLLSNRKAATAVLG